MAVLKMGMVRRVASGLLVAAWFLALAGNVPAQGWSDKGKGARSDWEWLHRDASALLVFEPPKLKGVTRWAIESPRHRGTIRAMAASPDGMRVATGGVDGIVRFWNLEKGEFEKAFVAHRHHIHTMAWSPDGRMLATQAGAEARTKVWEIETGKLLEEMKSVGHLRSLAWSKNSRQLAGGTDGSGHVYVSTELGEYAELTEMGKPVYVLEWSPDGTRLAVSSYGNPVALVDASSGKSVVSLDQPADEFVTAIKWAPDGETFATGAVRSVAVWKSGDGAEVSRVTAVCSDLAWSPDSKRLLTSSVHGGQLWNPADGKALGRLPVKGFVEWHTATNRILGVTETEIEVWEPDGKEPKVAIDAGGDAAPVFQAGKPVVTGLGGAVLSVWDQNTLRRLHRLEGHTKPVTAAAWSRDGKRFATAADDGTVRLWDVVKGRPLEVLTGHTGPIAAIAWSPDGECLASAGGTQDRSVRLWKASGQSTGVLEGHAKAILALSWSPNGKQLVSAGGDDKLIVWDAAKGSQDRTISVTSSVNALDWTSLKGSPALACGFRDSGIRVINPVTGAELAIVADGNNHAWHGGTTAVAWMPGPQPRILAGRWALTQVWDVAQHDTVQRQLAPGGAASVFPTAGGTLAAVRANDRTVRFWDPAGGTLRGVLLDEGGALVAVSTGADVKFDPDVPPDLIAIVETDDGQRTIPLDELKQAYGWKNNAKMLKLPARN